jgi:hypothetical protein
LVIFNKLTGGYMGRLRLIGLIILMCSAPLNAHKYSAGFSWNFNFWGISGRYFITPNFYIQGTGIFGSGYSFYEERQAFSVGGGIGNFFNVDEWVRPFVGVSGGGGSSKERWRGYYNDQISRTIKFGGRVYGGVSIAVLQPLLREEGDKGVAGLTLEFETGVALQNYAYNDYNQPGLFHYYNALYFPDFGAGIYYNW